MGDRDEDMKFRAVDRQGTTPRKTLEQVERSIFL
jgi:hypothetical protein